MDQIVYLQVIITCTTINVIIIITSIAMWVVSLMHDHCDKKKDA